jgi:hypothetical protein
MAGLKRIPPALSQQSRLVCRLLFPLPEFRLRNHRRLSANRVVYGWPVIHQKRLILVRETSECLCEIGLFHRRTSALGGGLRAQGRQARQVDHFKLIGSEVGDIKRLAVGAKSLFAWK